jgi:DNA-binding transcriptional MocR family regulator
VVALNPPAVHEQRPAVTPRQGASYEARPGDGREAGALLAGAGTADAIDATVLLLVAPGDRILTSDPGDLARLAAAAGDRAVIIGCRIVSAHGRRSRAH